MTSTELARWAFDALDSDKQGELIATFLVARTLGVEACAVTRRLDVGGARLVVAGECGVGHCRTMKSFSLFRHWDDLDALLLARTIAPHPTLDPGSWRFKLLPVFSRDDSHWSASWEEVPGEVLRVAELSAAIDDLPLRLEHRRESPLKLVARATVYGTPRTYGSRRTEDVLRLAIESSTWWFDNDVRFPLDDPDPVFLRLRYRVHPVSYRGRCPNGPDLDTLVIGTIGGLVVHRGNQRPTAALLVKARCISYVKAEKVPVTEDAEAGIDIEIFRGHPLRRSDLPLPEGGFHFPIPRARGDFRERARNAVPPDLPPFTAGDKVGVQIVFGAHVVNIVSEDRLEGVIDGVAGAPAGGATLFPPAKGQRTPYGYDDSSIVALECARVEDLCPEHDARACLYRC